MLRGSLSEFPLPDVLAFLRTGAKTGTLEVRGLRTRGSLEITGGELTSVRLNDDEGEIALGGLLALTEGAFNFRPGETGPPTLLGPLEDLLGRGRAHAERIAAASLRIPDDRVRFALSRRAVSVERSTVTGAQWAVIVAIDAQRGGAEISAVCGNGRLATLCLLDELIAGGLVDILPAETAAEADARRALTDARSPRRRARAVVPGSPANDLVPAPTTFDARLAALAASYPPASVGTERSEPADRPKGRWGLLGAVSRVVGLNPRPGRDSMPAPDDVPAPGVVGPRELALLANALMAECASGRYGEALTTGIHDRLRDIYQHQPIGLPLPVVGESLDVTAFARAETSPGLVLPYLAMLIGQLREDAERTFGKESAGEAYAAALRSVGGAGIDDEVAEILRRSSVPAHGRLLLISGGGQREYKLGPNRYVIGGSPSSEIVLTGSGVAERHALLSPYLDSFTIRDLGSSGGTTVNGVAISGSHYLSGGEVIGIGEIELRFERPAG